MKIIVIIIISQSYKLSVKNERSINFLAILKFLIFKQRFKYLINEKINFIKMILKLKCLFYQNIYIWFHLFLYSYSHFNSNKSKKIFNRKNTPIINYITNYSKQKQIRQEKIKCRYQLNEFIKKNEATFSLKNVTHYCVLQYVSRQVL